TCCFKRSPGCSSGLWTSCQTLFQVGVEREQLVLDLGEQLVSLVSLAVSTQRLRCNSMGRKSEPRHRLAPASPAASWMARRIPSSRRPTCATAGRQQVEAIVEPCGDLLDRPAAYKKCRDLLPAGGVSGRAFVLGITHAIG